MQQIAIVFEDSLRPETTGTYCLRALQELVREGMLRTVQHFLPSQVEGLDQDQFEAVLFVDDGLGDELPRLRIPTAWWAIDTHLSFERCLRKARRADLTFAAQKNGAERLRVSGIASASWLPLACDPEIHGRREVSKQFDVAFIGHDFPGERRDLLQLIRREFPQSFIGTADYRQLGEIYSSARIVFNRSLRDDVNMRVFEGLCSGSLLVTNHLTNNGQDELLIPGEHLVTYRAAEELLEKVRYYLAHADEREQIAAAGRERVLRQHTYRHRMEVVLQKLEGWRGQRSGDRGQGKGTTPSFPLTDQSSLSDPCPLPPGPSSSKSTTYYEFSRPDVLELVPPSARRILDIGCGGGRLGESIKSRQAAHVTGIELNPQAIDAACQRLDEVIIGDVQSPGIEFPERSFDCVICADVLEHLRDPFAVLEKIRRWLSPEGTLVTSIPNVRNHQVIRSLLAGNWTYESAGLLDDDHVRFFTRREIEKLLFRAGFQIQEQRMIGGEGFQEWAQQGFPKQIQIGPFQLHAQSQEEAAEFFAYQYLTTATPASAPEFGLTSIVIVTHNQWPHTQGCLESLRLRTDLPHEIIVVDNGSTDGTPQRLEQFGHVRVIRNSENRGFPAAANQGILASQGQQVLLLNNDTLVTTGWLERLLTALNRNRDIGLAGPVTNHISGEQQVPVSYDDLAQLDGFAWDWGKRHHRQTTITDRLVGFCLLIKREVIDRIGLLDEQFGIGNFEDDDYCRRAIAAGYQCVIARDAFIHHVGSATFRASGVDFVGLLQKNQQKYQEKWNGASSLRREAHHGDTEARRGDIERIETHRTRSQLQQPPFQQTTVLVEKFPCLRDSVVQHDSDQIDGTRSVVEKECLAQRRSDAENSEVLSPSIPSASQRLRASSSLPETSASSSVSPCLRGEPTPRGSPCRPHYLLELNDQGEFLLKPNTIKLSVCLIVRDNEHTIRPCLESLKPWVDEIVVVDTGSLDATPRICEELGARVFHSPWQDSFSQARNVSLSFARGEWIFWMDSDDTLPEHCGRQLRELANGSHSDNVLGYIAQVHCPGMTPDDVTVVDHVKLIRNRPNLRFEFHIHEQILPAIRRAGGDVAWTDFYVVHSGSDKTPAGRARKLERDFKLLARDLAQHPDHPFVLFNLGMTHADAGNNVEAVRFLQRCLQVSTPQESHVRKAHALLIGTLMQMRQWAAAQEACRQGLQHYPDDKELLFRMAMLQHQHGQLREAEASYHRILSEQTDRHFTSVDRGISDYKARHNLAIVYEDLGEYDQAQEQWNRILTDRPDYVPAQVALRQLNRRISAPRRDLCGTSAVLQ